LNAGVDHIEKAAAGLKARIVEIGMKTAREWYAIFGETENAKVGALGTYLLTLSDDVQEMECGEACVAGAAACARAATAAKNKEEEINVGRIISIDEGLLVGITVVAFKCRSSALAEGLRRFVVPPRRCCRLMTRRK
jgi:hypothetical protein